MKAFKLPPLRDMHLHLRQDDESMLRTVVPYSARCCASALVMPNTKIPVTTGEHVDRDYAIIKKLSGHMEPLMTIKINGNTTPEIIRSCGAIAGKIYPEGMTTNSENGISRAMFDHPPQQLLDTFDEMQKSGMVLCLHGEMPGHEVLDREVSFLEWTGNLLKSFPKLKVVLEHITDSRSVDFVKSITTGNLAATITVHHLYLTLDDIIGDKLNPHAFCKPVAKFLKDREALLRAALSGDSRFFLGTDSAPHTKFNKECCGCAGVFSSPVMIEALAELFETHYALDKLENFTSRFAEAFYNLSPVSGNITLVTEPWRVPDTIVIPNDGHCLVPFMAGQTLKWRLFGWAS